MAADIPENEVQRLEALARYGILDSKNAPEFDDIALLAAEICDAPIALISFVDGDRQWFKSRVGLEAEQTARAVSFCAHAIHGDTLFEVPDTLADQRFHDNPLVIGAPKIRYYAGMPLVTADGFKLGTLCIINHVHHQLSAHQRKSLRILARQVIGLLESHAEVKRNIVLTQQMDEIARFRDGLLNSAEEAVISTDIYGTITVFNAAAERLFGYHADELVGLQTPLIFYPAELLAKRNAKLRKSLGRKPKPSEVYAAYAADMVGRRSECIHVRKDGSHCHVLLSVNTMLDFAGNLVGFMSIAQDIAERKAAAEEIKQLAFYDTLTKLPNRRLLLDRLNQAMLAGERSQDKCALLFIDLDNFKNLNDIFGHDKGDQLLVQVAERLNKAMRKSDTVARLGGDEFVVMLENLSSDDGEALTEVKRVGEKILSVLNQPYQLGDYVQSNSPSIGATLFCGQSVRMDELMKQADMAMYQAKAAGRNCLRFFDPEMQVAVAEHAALEADLYAGMENKEFMLFYQPQINDKNMVIGAEALLRWQHPIRGMVPPVKFIPQAEESGLILKLGRWVLETGCAQLVAWASNPQTAALNLSINVSARQFSQPDFVEQVLVVLAETGANPYRLKLELTESMLVEDMHDIIAKMTLLKAQGVGFSLDDFGTGFSSLSYLKRLPLDQLKIDQSFVRDILTDTNDAIIARTIVGLAKSLDLEVIAEGVETKQQRDFLSANDCLNYQGYLFSCPVAIEAFDAFVASSYLMPVAPRHESASH